MADPITLHTKYRPTKFSDVIGQDHFIKQLGDITSDRTSQAYLFHGPAGCGKTTLARICARKLGCKPSDIIEHDGATKNGVEEMRNLQTAVRYKPIGGGSVRAVILDEVHRVTGQAFDSILTAPILAVLHDGADEGAQHHPSALPDVCTSRGVA
jgi:DNA polymerase-3 subunit gamma/tau